MVFNQISSAARSLSTAFSLLWTQKKLWGWAAAPIVIFLILFSLAYTASWPMLAGLLGGILMDVPSWLGVILEGLAWLIYLGILTVLVYFAGQIFLSPLSAMLVEKVLGDFGYQIPRQSFKHLVISSLKMMYVGIIRSVLLLCVAGVLLLMSLSGFLAPIAIIAAFLILVFDLSDYPFEVFQFSLRQRFEFFFRNIFGYSFFALVVAFITLVPGLIFVCLPFLLIAISHYSWSMLKRERGSGK